MDSSELVSQFIAVTGASAKAGAFFLDSAGGDLSGAIDQYYASGGNAGGAGPASAVQDAQPGPPAPIAAAALDSGLMGGPSMPSGLAPVGRRPPRAKRPSAGNVRGLADLGGDEEESEDDEHNDYYVGGEKSGQLVRGAPQKFEGAPGRIEQLFESARRSGAVDGSAEGLGSGGPGEGAPAGGPRPSAFTGAARTLAGPEPPAAPAAAASQAQQAQQGPVTHTITFYGNGVFTVDDGEPRSVADAANQPFLRSIEQGECPAELEPGSRATPVTVNLLRRQEDYVPPDRPKYVAFRGEGRKLADADAGAAGASGGPVDGQWEGVDEGAPTTSIQLRLADGSRMVARFNLTHNVADIRRFIRASRPDMPAAFQLLTAFPSQPLDDNNVSIEEASLANAVIIQKL